MRVHEASAGNPFFSLELARTWIDRGGVADVGHLPVPKRLGDLLRSSLDGLPEGTRRVLLLAAAMATPSVKELGQATGRPVERDIARAERAGIIDSSGGTVRFTHPLMAGGATDVAAIFAQRALEFTVPGDLDAAFRRATAAGQLALAAGDRSRARVLFERAVADAPRAAS